MYYKFIITGLAKTDLQYLLLFMNVYFGTPCRPYAWL